MKLLEDKIIKEGKVYPGDILKIDSFLNHQIDSLLMDEIGKEFYRLFNDLKPTKILTIESSGIAIALATARYFDNCPIIFAKKQTLLIYLILILQKKNHIQEKMNIQLEYLKNT